MYGPRGPRLSHENPWTFLRLFGSFYRGDCGETLGRPGEVKGAVGKVGERSYSKDHNNLTLPLSFRTYQIIPHTNSYFHCLYSYPDLLPQGPWGTPGGQSPPGTLGATGEGLDSCEDSESIC